MEIKSFDEVKAVIKQFPEASGVGYVVAPQLLKIGGHLGLPGCLAALEHWKVRSVIGEKVFVPGETIPTDNDFLISWEGPSLIMRNAKTIVGIKRLIEEIESALAQTE